MDMKIQNKKYVIPAKAGIQQVVEYYMYHKSLDSRFRGNDVYVGQQWPDIVSLDTYMHLT